MFEWNNYSLSLPRLGVWERRQKPPPLDTREEENKLAHVNVDVLKELDYSSASDAEVALVLEENTLGDKIHQLREEVESPTVRQWFGIHHIAASNKVITFFAR